MDADRRKKLESLERRVGYSFNDKRLLDMALTHTSYVKGDGRASAHNERLEFLGDAVLELCVSEYLYNRFAEYNEGDMTRLRAQTVCEGALYDVAKKAGTRQIASAWARGGSFRRQGEAEHIERRCGGADRRFVH